MSITQVSLKSIVVDPAKIPGRSLINEEAVQALAQKLLRGNAVMSPLLVWRDVEHEGERYLLVSGRCRLEAARRLKWLTVPVAILQGSLREARSHAFQELAHPGSRGSHWDIAQMVVQIARAENLNSCRCVAGFVGRGKSQVAADLKIGRAFFGASVDVILRAAGLETADLTRVTKKTLLRVASMPGLTADDRLARLAELIVRQLSEAGKGDGLREVGGGQALECTALPDPTDAVAPGVGETRMSDHILRAPEVFPYRGGPAMAADEAGDRLPGTAEDDLTAGNLVGAMAPVGGRIRGTPQTTTSGAPPPGGQAMVARWGSSVVPRLQGALSPLFRPSRLMRAPAGFRVEASTQRPPTSVRPAILGLVLFLLILLACPGMMTPGELAEPEAVLLEAEGAGKTGIAGRELSLGPSDWGSGADGRGQRYRARVIPPAPVLPLCLPGSAPESRLPIRCPLSGTGRIGPARGRSRPCRRRQDEGASRPYLLNLTVAAARSGKSVVVGGA